MAILSLEDLSNFVEVLVFPKTYAKFPDLIKEDKLVYVYGRLSRREEEPKIVAEDIILLEKVKEKYTKSVLIKLSTTGLEETMMKKIKFCIQKFHGKVPVFIDFLSHEGRKIRLSVDNNLFVNPTDELLLSMEEIVGSGNVKFLTR
jgi:DNA polymerase III subunit alpha